MRRMILFFLGAFVLAAAVRSVPSASGFHRCEKEFQAWQQAKADVQTAKANRDRASQQLTARAVAKENAKTFVGGAREEMYAAEDAYAAARTKYAECVVENADKEDDVQDMACMIEKAEMDTRGELYNSALQVYKDAKRAYDEALDAWADAMANLRRAETELDIAYQKCARAYAAYMTCMTRFA